MEGHGPIGSLVVKTRATVPLEISAELGLYVVVSEPTFEKVPEPNVDHVALVAVPPIVPFNCTKAPAQIEVSLPAFSVGGISNKIVAASFTEGQGEIIPVAVSVNVTFPVVPIGGKNIALRVLAFG